MNTNQKIASLDGAAIEWNGSSLIVTNGEFKRQWDQTACGLMTVLLENAGKKWVEIAPKENGCDWHLYMLAGQSEKAELVDVKIEAIENPPLTSPHVSAVMEFVYPQSELALRYAVQAFPSAVGVRTQISVRSLRLFDRDEFPSYLLESYAESLSLPVAKYMRRAVGYYNDLQHRNHDDTPILKEKVRSGKLEEKNLEVYDWANLISIEEEDAGIVLLKESHKCVNQQGVDTGSFVLHEDDICVTGLGLQANNYIGGTAWLRSDRFHEAWATWCIPYTGGEAGRQLAVKRFDRARFMPHPENLMHSHSNTWGTRYPGDPARAAATQDEVLKEIASCADLGIDSVMIDDGWQCAINGLEQGDNNNWQPHIGRFPEGWQKVHDEAAKTGVELQLWIPGQLATLQQMISNFDKGGFKGMKIDFLNLPARDMLDDLIAKISQLVKYTNYNLRISWDVTENLPRLGYYFAREFGSLHIANRKPTYKEKRVNHIAYCPRLVLRDAWQLAKYINLNQIEIPVQDVEKIDPAVNNASEYSHAYCMAVALTAIPLFFQETKFLSDNARDQIRPLMHLWQEHRNAIANGYTFPIGDQPCDKAWTGFQNHNPETCEGYVLVFRELDASDPHVTLPLHFVEDKPLKWQNVLSGETWSDDHATGAVTCNIETAPGFCWLKYSPENV